MLAIRTINSPALAHDRSRQSRFRVLESEQRPLRFVKALRLLALINAMLNHAAVYLRIVFTPNECRRNKFAGGTSSAESSQIDESRPRSDD